VKPSLETIAIQETSVWINIFIPSYIAHLMIKNPGTAMNKETPILLLMLNS
tara:strand:- start:1168 stop:1320 length:153 start_codon:yes stop_codon:yes gene_type:complete